MSEKKSFLFKVLLNHFNMASDKSYFSCVSPEEANAILKQTTTVQNIKDFLMWPQNSLARTHYSWLEPVLDKIPPFLQNATLNALPQGGKLQKLLRRPAFDARLSSPVKTYLTELFFQKWNPEQIFPPTYLPPSSLNPILELSKSQLVELIDFISVYDIADIILSIVDKNILNKINNYLSPDKKEFLRTILKKKNKSTAPKLDLATWDGKPESLQYLLHKRGLLRFSQTVSTQSPDFIWHLSHILDTGRGKTIISNYKQGKSDAAILPLIEQVLFLLNFLKSRSKA